jgi:metal-sulfur cluster biosynthetic enzyme
MDGVIMTTEPEVTKDDVIEALKEVYDPEIPLNIID